MEYPVIYLEAGSKKDVSGNTKVFNVEDLPYYLWINISYDISSQFGLFEMHESTSKCNIEIPVGMKEGIVQYESPRPWVRVSSDGLSHSIGLHIYKMSFANRKTDVVIDQYFGYIIQSDNPCKPYNYMEKRRCKCYGCVNLNTCKQTLHFK